MLTDRHHPVARRRLAALAVALLVSACAAAAPGGFDTTGHYTTKTPYAAPDAAHLTPPPPGFRPLMVQLVARHGSRPLSSPDDDDLSLQVWRRARAEGALTPLGEALGAVLEDMRAVHAEVGYGAISARGVREHAGLAARLLDRQRPLFAAAADAGRPIVVLHSGRERAGLSATAFTDALRQGLPALAPHIEPATAAPQTVYFHDAANTDAAAAYRRYEASDPRLLRMLDALKARPETQRMARRLLTALYADSFVDRLAEGAYRFQAAADPDDRIDDAVDAAASLYSLYAIAINLDDEGGWHFGRFIDPEAAAWFAMLDDAETFYERGPAFADDDVTWRAAEVLLDDFLTGIDAAATDPQAPAAVLRFTHAQALIPFAALLAIPGMHEGLPEDQPYDYSTSAWRSADVSPMAANVQWDVYTDDAGTVLVRMLHNERQVPFVDACVPTAGTTAFYTLAEIRHCYVRPAL